VVDLTYTCASGMTDATICSLHRVENYVLVIRIKVAKEGPARDTPITALLRG
jgi:hypothetical protein